MKKQAGPFQTVRVDKSNMRENERKIGRGRERERERERERDRERQREREREREHQNHFTNTTLRRYEYLSN